jgi:hypothetical protein
MSTSEPESQSCWECHRGKILRLPCGGQYVDCPPANWKGRSCAARLLDSIEKSGNTLVPEPLDPERRGLDISTADVIPRRAKSTKRNV